LNDDGELVGPIILRKDTAANLAGVTLSQGEIAFETDLERLLAGDGATAGGFDAAWGAGGAVVVRPTDDHADNASKLTAAYNIAKTLTPGGNALDSGNRAAVILLPGRYDYEASSGLELDTNYVDLIGVGFRDSVQIATDDADGYALKISASTRIANMWLKDAGGVGNTCLENNTTSSDVVMVNVRLTDTIDTEEWAGRYENIYSASGGCFGGTASGTFINCDCGYSSFGVAALGAGVASGTFINCTGGQYAFGGNECTASGTFKNCHAGAESFGADGTASGTFINCTSGDEGFGGNGLASGTFKNCHGGNDSFGGSSSSDGFTGTAHDCTADGYGFGALKFTGEAYNCHATLAAFGVNGVASTASAVMVGCTLMNSGYNIDQWEGRMERCTIEITAANTDAVVVGSGARIYDCTLIATGTGKSVNAGSAVNAVVAHCRMNNGLGANVTNDIGTPYNVDDTDIDA
jgi:hypothetical protein